MARQGYTKRSLAPLVGVNDYYLGRVIRGHEPLSERVRNDVARILGHPADRLWSRPTPARAQQ